MSWELQLKETFAPDHLAFCQQWQPIALQLAIKALNSKEKIITTPFFLRGHHREYPREAGQPVYVDILPGKTHTIHKIEASHHPQHDCDSRHFHVLCIPCEVEAIQQLATTVPAKSDLRWGAYAFWVKVKGKIHSLNMGYQHTHFHCHQAFSYCRRRRQFFTNSAELTKKLGAFAKFGHSGPYEFDGTGELTGKNSEIPCRNGAFGASLTYRRS